MNKKQKILIIAATHGNEKIGLETAQKLKSKKLDLYFDLLIANPQALKAGKRFLEADLNRSYPGDNNSPILEKRLAAKNFKIAQKYRYIVDIHEASAGQDDFVIVPRKKLSEKFPIKLIDLKRILLWPEPRGPISQIMKNAIELEFGMQKRNRKEAIRKATLIMEKFIKHIYIEKESNQHRAKEIYYVYGTLAKDKTVNKTKLVDFKLTKIKNDQFYPLLVGQYENLGIACYKMKKVN